MIKSGSSRPRDTRFRVRRVWGEQLLVRTLAYFLLLSLVPLIVVGLIAYHQGRRTLEQNMLDHLTTTATLKEDEINRWVASLEQDVELLAQNPFLTTLAEDLLSVEGGGTRVLGGREVLGSEAAHDALREYLVDVQRQKGDFSELMILREAGGEVVVSTTPAREGSNEVTSNFFTEGRRRTYVQNVYPSASTGGPAMTVATPLRLSSGGGVIGVLAAHLNLERLDDIMLEQGGLGTTGETYLVDQSNLFVSQARTGREEFPRGVHTVGIDAALVDKADGAGVYENYRGVPVIGAYRWVDERDVALLAEMELEEALTPARQLAWGILLVGLVAGVVVAGVGYGVSHQISQPILEVAEASARMAAGDLDQAVTGEATLARQDEIGTLARSFNDMAAQLQGAIGELEDRVADRTRELERRALQLATAADVGRAAASILDLGLLMARVVELVRDRFDLYYAGLFLLDDAGEYALLEAGTGEPGRIMKGAGHKLAVGGLSMVGAACSARQAQIALDIAATVTGATAAEGAGPRSKGLRLRGGARFDNPLLPDTRSEMALPLLVGDRVLGALDVQSTREAAFSEGDIAVLQLVADQVAVAVDNARKFSQEAGLLEATSPLYRASHRLAASTTVDQVSAAILDTVAETEADGCTVAQFDLGLDGEVMGVTFLARSSKRDAGFGFQDSAGGEPGLGSPQLLPKVPVSESEMLPLSLVRSVTTIDDILTDDRVPEGARQALQRMGIRALVLVPLRVRSRPGEDDVPRSRAELGPPRPGYSAQGGPRVLGSEIGFLMVDRVTPGPFSPVSLRLYETVADQAAAALDRARLLEASQQQAWREHRIRQLSDRVTSSFDLDQVLRATVEELAELIGASGGYVEIGPEGTQRVPARVAPGTGA
ncbi:MAG: GAF domain-containing protein [Anaerolineae bacterium]|nr:GAF domain-containing protein [Anaerolineae bacterium]